MNIPTNLKIKTGFNPLIESDVNKEFIATIMSMVSLFSEEAMILASHYTIYNGRETVTSEDLIKALKYRALDNNPEYWEKPEIITKMQTIYNDYMLKNSDNEVDSDNEIDSDEVDSDNEIDSDEVDSDNEIDEFQYLDVSKTVLDKMNNIEDIWSRFEPKENSEFILKNAIENTEKKFLQ